MATLTRRAQILLDESRYAALQERARRERRSVADVVRDGIDRVLSDNDPALEERMHSIEQFLSAEPVPVADPQDLKEELLDAHSAKLSRD